jgi:nucleoside-diphosphate-sugar epimerase
MRVLVTGATGRVGSRLVPRLLQQGEMVRALVRERKRGKPLEEHGAELVMGDLRDAETLDRSLDGVDAVVHLAAAFRRVPDEEAIAVNEQATSALGRASAEAGVRRLIFTSTNLVYGPGRGRPAREDDAPAPDTGWGVYPLTKAKAEEALHGIGREDGLDLRILRLAFVYGDGDPHLSESMMWAREWPAHKRLHLVHHADVAQAVSRAVHAEGLDGQTFNVADDAPVTAAEVHELNEEPLAPGAAARLLEDPWEGIVDTSRARAELGVRPLYPTVYTARDAGAL